MDFGAGSHTNNNKKRSISSIAKNSSVNASKGRLLFRLANYFQPHTMLELGTSLGLSAMYLAGYSQNASLITLEGNPDSATIAKNNWEKTGIKNIECVTGNFHETLDPALKNLPNIDLAYIDGNHTYRATIDNCKKIMQRMHEDAVLILDDIHWSHEMKKAWDELSALPEISVSIDLFDLGLLFFKKDQEKEHFILRFNPKKPAL